LRQLHFLLVFLLLEVEKVVSSVPKASVGEERRWRQQQKEATYLIVSPFSLPLFFVECMVG
jgi:hypothetical protein